MFSWRAIRPDRLRESLRINPSAMGNELVGESRAFAAWQWLLRSPPFQAAFVESDERIKGHRIVGFGASVFVSARFAERECADPRPGLNARIVSSIVSGHPVVLTYDELRRGNARGSLNLIPLQHCWRADLLTPSQCQETHRQLCLAAVYYEEGYRVQRILVEATCNAEIEFMKALRVYDVHSTFENFHGKNPENSWNRERSLFSHMDCVTLVVPASNNLEPALRLGRADQALLAVALRGLTDVELSKELHLKLPTVKKRWASVFHRFAIAKPSFMLGLDDNLDRKTNFRGH